MLDLSESWRKHRAALLGLSVVVLALVFLAAHTVLGPEVPAYAVTRSDIVQTVVASGRVETPLRVEIGSQVTGTVAAIPVAEGQDVKAGQLLIALENSEASATVTQARAAVAQAQRRLEQLRDVGLPTAQQGLRQAEIALNNARRQHERTQELHSKGFVGEAQLDDAQRALDTAQSQYRAAQLQVATNGPQGSDYRMAMAALEQAQANLRMALARLEYTSIKAPVDGTLIARNVERGHVVQPGKILMVLSPAGQTQLVLQIDEKNLSTLRLGQQAIGSADAYPDDRFAAELAYINPAVDPQRGSVEVKLNVPHPPVYLRQDMTVSVDIEVARKTNAVVSASAAVHDIGGKAPWVMKVNGGKAHRMPVRLGVRGSGKLEFLEGVQPGDVLLAATNAVVSDGERVRPVVHAPNGTPEP
ncbi:MAG TPA: efflux RND transporter periplasmic adaptor subunit [Noviherbaspirillum sp.]|uniref:efflux RND transporter periplasmic adaptor subunit n=1 Tax=Noviherbaspirillum sp. TaxID=1926288 RepID=UPI002B49EA0F|nr:efflux RND transporter periplasmic adaptor subunit [Noviherbaspirillum sp.]HJV88596.1 efflux RND transporter periplasmic adaptor subunit [Noviherbaspirillum sp.]